MSIELTLTNLASLPIPVAARSEARVYCAGIAGSHPAGVGISLSCDCCVLSGRDLCVGLITRAEESVVYLSVIAKLR